MQTHVRGEQDADVATLIFACDQPGKPPTLDYQVLDELDMLLAGIEGADPPLRAVVLRSDSDRYFVVGANIRALESLDSESIVPWVRRGHAVFNRLEALPLPVIARLDGYTLGGGLELAMACDLIVASAGARLGQPEANLGLIAGWGGTYRLPRRVGAARAKELFFTGKVLDASEAFAVGLVDYAGDRASAEEYLASLLESLRKVSPLAVAQMKRLVNAGPLQTLDEVCAAEAEASRLCMQGADAQSRLAAFLDSRKKR